MVDKARRNSTIPNLGRGSKFFLHTLAEGSKKATRAERFVYYHPGENNCAGFFRITESSMKDPELCHVDLNEITDVFIGKQACTHARIYSLCHS